VGRKVQEESKVPENQNQNSSFGAGYRIGSGAGNNSSFGNGYKMGEKKDGLS
jgi:hypothetical protein